MPRYRDLPNVEMLFRVAKATRSTRAILHSSDAAIRGHIFSLFLALVLRKELFDRCTEAGLKLERADLLRVSDLLCMTDPVHAAQKGGMNDHLERAPRRTAEGRGAP